MPPWFDINFEQFGLHIPKETETSFTPLGMFFWKHPVQEHWNDGRTVSSGKTNERESSSERMVRRFHLFSPLEIGSVLLTAKDTLFSTNRIQDLSCRKPAGEGRGRRGNPIVVYPVRRSLRKQSIHPSIGAGKHTAPTPATTQFRKIFVSPCIFVLRRLERPLFSLKVFGFWGGSVLARFTVESVRGGEAIAVFSRN